MQRATAAARQTPLYHCYGTSAEFVTRLPARALGQAAIHSLRARGAGTRYIVRGGDRLGVYYVEQGAGYRGQTIDFAAAAGCLKYTIEGDVNAVTSDEVMTLVGITE